MKMVMQDEKTGTYKCALDLNGRHVMPAIPGSQVESSKVIKSTQVILDNYDQRESLAKFLEKKNYKMSDGMMGTQRDFSKGSNPDGIVITLQVADPDDHEKMRKVVKEWAHKINSQKRKIPA